MSLEQRPSEPLPENAIVEEFNRLLAHGSVSEAVNYLITHKHELPAALWDPFLNGLDPTVRETVMSRIAEDFVKDFKFKVEDFVKDFKFKVEDFVKDFKLEIKPPILPTSAHSSFPSLPNFVSASQEPCWFCGQHIPSDARAMLEEVLYYPRSFQLRDYRGEPLGVIVQVPRCAECKAAHDRADNIRSKRDKAGSAKAGLVVLIGLMILTLLILATNSFVQTKVGVAIAIILIAFALLGWHAIDRKFVTTQPLYL